jgi:hypothetical protein
MQVRQHQHRSQALVPLGNQMVPRVVQYALGVAEQHRQDKLALSLLLC